MNLSDPNLNPTVLKELADYILARTTRLPATGCLIWNGATTADGAGVMVVGGTTLGVHRVVYRALRGPIPRRGRVLHSCDYPACVEPLHLFCPAPKARATPTEGPPEPHVASRRGPTLTPKTRKLLQAMRRHAAAALRSARAEDIPKLQRMLARPQRAKSNA